MTQLSNPALISGLQAVGWLFIGASSIGVLLWLFEPVFYPGAINRFFEWFRNAKLPPTDPISYSADFDEPFRDKAPLSPEEALRHESLETKEEFDKRELEDLGRR